ncbi:prolyl oligopeptidase family serine peptidase [Pseudoxanthomonas sp.]|uniref:alpha/beta hydrolase family protein n=1 Tax=Pseudoxanthomonas sp. TaxID=1871049 RepID=UPI002FE025C9
MKLLTFLLLSLVAVASVPALAANGLAFREVHEATTGTAMPATVIYPAAGPAASTELGPYGVAATPGLAIADGRHPLVLISHGHGGSTLGHHDLATALADAGFIVAAIEHAGDSHRDQSGFGTERVLLGRAWQMSALLDLLLADPQLGPHIDADRVGVAGFSAGGYTSLLLLGATPDFARREAYCAAQPADAEVCVEVPAVIERLPVSRATTDPRIRAGFVMAPFAIFFDAAALAHVDAPVFLYGAMADRVLLPAYNLLPVRDGLPRLHAFRGIVGAGHYVFLAPCSAGMAAALPALCVDPTGIDRGAVHRQINADAVGFFQEVLAPR